VDSIPGTSLPSRKTSNKTRKSADTFEAGINWGRTVNMVSAGKQSVEKFVIRSIEVSFGGVGGLWRIDEGRLAKAYA
jgi:hypothetical protein